MILIAISSLLLGAALVMVVGCWASARIKGVLATLACAPAIVAVAGMMPAVHSGGAIDWGLGARDGLFALAFHADGLSVLFAAMGVVLGACVLLYSIGYMAEDPAATRFYCTMLVFIAGFVALVTSANLLLAYACWETIGLCSFSLVGFWYRNPEAVHGSRKVLLTTHIAGYGFLAAVLILYHRSGSMLWTDPALSHAFTGGVFTLMLIALAAKSVQVPLHTWIPDAMAAPTPVSALLHAACYVTAGVYLAARMHSIAPWPWLWSGAMVWLGTATMVVGVMYAMVQTDLKRMLAFSTVSQIGYMLMAIGIGTPLALVAGLLHCLTHGFFKGGLFLCAGAVQHATGTRDMNELGGLAEKMPRTTMFWLAGVGGMMGVPLMSGFVSKWMIYAAALEAGWLIPALVAWTASLGTVFLCAKATSAVFLGPATESTEHAHEAPASMQWGMGLLAAGNIALGVAPQFAVNTLLLPVVRAMGMQDGVQVTWLGLSATGATFSTTGGLILAIVSLLVGGVIYAMVRAGSTTTGAVLAGAGGGIFTGGEPLTEHSRLMVSDFADIFQHNWGDFFRWSDVDRVYAACGRGLTAASRGMGVAVAWMEARAAWLTAVLFVAMLALVRWVQPSAATVMGTESGLVPFALMLACAAAGVALVITAMAHAKTRGHVVWMLAAAALTVAGLTNAAPWPRLMLLEAGALVTLVLVARTVKTSAARWAYGVVVVLSAASALAAQAMLWTGAEAWARALVLAGICLKLAAVPLMFWLLRIADEVPAVVLGLVIAVVDMAAFGEFLLSAQAMPGLLMPSALVLTIAAVTALGGAVLMLAQRSVKRMLVLSTVEDVGFLLLGASAAGWAATEQTRALALGGAVAGAATHALGKALLFTSVSSAEADGALNDEAMGLATRYPVSGFGFLLGMLAMLGVPPTMGFAGRWRLYETALGAGRWMLVVFVAASACALIAYATMLARVWWGPPPDDAKPGRESLTARAVIVLLATVIVVAGVWPQALTFLTGGRP
ncbi:MAG: proton-conducting transporter membrane subunit [Terracidiphilus sp.]|nr:proton-conducting transporter membrane subunit [Terracidiphilus sp.]